LPPGEGEREGELCLERLAPGVVVELIVT
jgi:hypothetical protein